MQDLRGRVMDLLDDPSLEAVKVIERTAFHRLYCDCDVVTSSHSRIPLLLLYVHFSSFFIMNLIFFHLDVQLTQHVAVLQLMEAPRDKVTDRLNCTVYVLSAAVHGLCWSSAVQCSAL